MNTLNVGVAPDPIVAVTLDAGTGGFTHAAVSGSV